MNFSRREAIQLSGGAIAALSVVGAARRNAAAQTTEPVTDGLVDTRLRSASRLALQPDGSAVEYAAEDIEPIEGVLWKTDDTPDIDFDYRRLRVNLDVRGTANLSGTLTFDHLDDLPRHSQITLLQCGAPVPRGIVKWTGVRFSDLADSIGIQHFAYYGRFVGSDGYFIDEDIRTLMHPQVMLAWLMNDAPIPPEHGAPLRLIIPFRYGARSMKAITDIELTATGFAQREPWPA